MDEAGAFVRLEHAINSIKLGGFAIVIDHPERENEGDLICAAEDITAEKINFMIQKARGLICLPMASELLEPLSLPLMRDLAPGPSDGAAFTVSIDACLGISTGVSASDRAKTILEAVKLGAKRENFVVPGHVFPLCAKKNGVLERRGHTEASVDLMRLSQKKPAAVICEIIKDDGEMARFSDLELFAYQFNIPILWIDDIVFYRQKICSLLFAT